LGILLKPIVDVCIQNVFVDGTRRPVFKDRLQVQIPSAPERVDALVAVNPIVALHFNVKLGASHLVSSLLLDRLALVDGRQSLPEVLLCGAIIVGARRLANALPTIAVELNCPSRASRLPVDGTVASFLSCHVLSFLPAFVVRGL